MKKILILTYYWPPSGGAGVQRWLKMSGYLVKRNYRPIIVTVDPKKASYPKTDEGLVSEVSDQVEVHHTNSFEPLNLYKKGVGKEKVPFGGFSNVNTETTLSKISRWVRGNFFIPDARKGWNKYAFEKADEILSQNPDIDVVITSGPPHSTHLVGLKLKENHDVKWIADFRDPWTDIYYYDQFLHTAYAKKVDKEFENSVLQSADKVLAVCDSNLELFKSKLSPSDKSKVHLIMNGFDEKDFIEKADCPPHDYLEIVYTGTMAETYNFYPILKAFKTLDFPWRFSIAGTLAPSFWETIEDLGISEHINYIGYVSHQKSLELLKCGDVLLHITPDLKNVPTGTSGKLFEYFGASKPILDIGPLHGDPAILIEKAENGKTFTRDMPKEIASFLKEIFENPDLLKKESNDHTLQYSRKQMTDNLIQIIESME